MRAVLSALSTFLTISTLPFFTPCAAAVLVVVCVSSASGEVTSAQVNAAIEGGVAYLEKQQRPDGRWGEYESEPGGTTALITLALLNSGRTTKDDSVRKALAYLERLPDPDHTYSSSL